MATYGVTENTDTELTQLVADGNHIQRAITLKVDCGDLSRGTVLEMVSAASGQWQQNTTSTTANARAILAQDVEDDDTNTQLAQAYFVGKYRASDLIWPDGITTTQKRTGIVALQDRGIIIDEAILSLPATTTTTTTTTAG